jgi:hypothetical protein
VLRAAPYQKAMNSDETDDEGPKVEQVKREEDEPDKLQGFTNYIKRERAVTVYDVVASNICIWSLSVCFTNT